MISLCILKEPKIIAGKVNKGALILSSVDYVCTKIPNIKQFFYLIERRGWEGINDSKLTDIKLVEDLSKWEETKNLFPNSILLDIGPADFVNTDLFKPIKTKKKYLGIQIARWEKFKRQPLFVKAAAMLPKEKFMLIGHFANNGDNDEIKLKEEIIDMSKKFNANIDFPFAHSYDNKCLPNKSEDINKIINHTKIAILTTKVEGINRFKMECLSANIPVLVPSDTSEPTKKHINSKTGYLFEPTPEGLVKAILYVKDNYKNFKPRQYILQNTGYKKSLKKLSDALNSLAVKEGNDPCFNNIFWDGRNQSLLWEEKALFGVELIIKKIMEIKV